MGKIIVLIVSILMPGREPDIDHQAKMESLEACWAAAQEFMSHDLNDAAREKGAVGLSARCAVVWPAQTRN